MTCLASCSVSGSISEYFTLMFHFYYLLSTIRVTKIQNYNNHINIFLMHPTIQQIHQSFYSHINFNEVEHLPSTFASQLFKVQESCLLINYDAFDLYYPSLVAMVTKKQNNFQQRDKAADILITMNGENQKAWNFKKQALLDKKLNLERQLKLNQAILMKFKKSTSCYEYRYRVMTLLLKQEAGKMEQIHENQNDLMRRILQRFHRNYFCWTYRLKLMSLMLKQQEKLLIREVEMVHKFIDSHPNDHSAFSYLRSLRRNYKIEEEEEKKWGENLAEFCKIAYEEEKEWVNLRKYMEQYGWKGE